MTWKEVDKDLLEKMYYDDNMLDSEIADLYHIPKSRVQYKRKKYGITFKKKFFKEFEKDNSEIFKKLNKDSQERLVKPENINEISKSLTHYIFRNGPVEDMHAEGKLTQQDMKILNKFMVNRLAGILETCINGEWLKLELLHSYYHYYGMDWDMAEPDKEELESTFNEFMKELADRYKK